MYKLCTPSSSLAAISSAIALLGASSVYAAPPIVEPPSVISSLQAPPSIATNAASTPAAKSNGVITTPTAPLTPASAPVAASSSSGASAATDDLLIPVLPLAPAPEVLKASAPADKQVCAPAPVVKKANKNAPLAQKVDAPEKVLAPEPKPEAEKSPFAGLSLTQVSDSQLNQFIFPEPVEGLYFPEGSPLPECPKNAQPQDPCKPIFLNGKKLLLLPMRVGAKGPVQMLAHLNSGRIVTFNLSPAQGPGTLVRVENADYSASDSRIAKAKNAQSHMDGNSASEMDIALLGRFVKGDIPAGYEPIAIAAPTRLAQFDLIPSATWSDGNQMKAHMIQIRPFNGEVVSINAGMFKGEGVKAVALDKDTASAKFPATVFILEQEVAK